METVPNSNRTFGPEQEKSIISLIFDEPDFFSNIAQHLKPDHFEEYATKYIYALVFEHFEKHGVVITRELCKDEALSQLKTDDDYEPILELIDRHSLSREVPIIRSFLVEWSRQRVFGELYSPEAFESYELGDYSAISDIVDKASRITDSSLKGRWFFQTTDSLFEENHELRLTTGFSRLDHVVNEGGPTYGDVFCWMAPTGVGKSIMLVNSGVANLRLNKNVIHVTMELSESKTAERYMGCISERPIKQKLVSKDRIERNILRFKNSYDSELIIFEFPPDDISVDAIYAVLDTLRTQHGITPDVVIIDYLELLLSRTSAYNTSGDDYARQKKVSTEIRQFAKKEGVLVFTASQTNRGGTETENKDSVIGLNKVAESYGKTMPMDYIVTVNQTKDEYNSGRINETDETSPNINASCRFFVAKNRNGPKFKTISAKINYETMVVKEADIF